jgi:hypothetical protein
VQTQPFTVINDTIAPTVAITVPSVAPLRFAVTWAGSDADPSTSSGQGSGVRHYEVQFKQAGEVNWSEWLTETSQTIETL